jgi:hypothetical protein
MSKVAITAVLALGILIAGGTDRSAAVASLPAGMKAAIAPLNMVQQARVVVRGGRGVVFVAPRRAVVVAPRRAVVVGPRHAVVAPAFIRPYRPFYRRPWFGTVVGGVALGTIVTVAAVGAAPAVAPAPELCWYWADAGMTQGFWDYCAPPY